TGGVRLSGVVLFDDKPVAGADVYAQGGNTTQRTRTTEIGRFMFPDLEPGTYTVDVVAPSGWGSLIVDLGSTGADLTKTLSTKRLGIVPAIVQPSPVRKAGTDVTLNSQALARSPYAGDFPSILVQLPGAARGANGVVHINGDHGD